MRRAALSTILGAAAAAAIAVPAFADGPPPAPPPVPQPGRIRLELIGGLAAHGRQYVLTGDNVTVVGHVKPYVAGQTARVRISTPHRKATVVHAAIRKGKGEGTF